LEVYKRLDIALPYIVSITLLDIKSHFLGFNSVIEPLNKVQLDRNMITLPDIQLDETVTDVSKALKPAFDTFWQCFGFPQSQNYDTEGNRVPRK
jgi:hypothetical protein